MTDLHMQTADIEVERRRLTAVYEDLTRAWESTRGGLQPGTAAVGTGTIADAIHARYTPMAEAVTRKAEAVPQRYVEVGSAASFCGNSYLAADARGREQCVARQSTI